eukprot:GHRR01036974.1.p2 GENE.GHRR01036974.1~~GHRR01036974.1.p2  ORF type:complete len:100 (+),score=26.98 GHRR01036974.1:523-822(+)
MELIELREQHMQLVVSCPHHRLHLACLHCCRPAPCIAAGLSTARTSCCVCLQARSQEARSNWETALEAKDRAIGQLEEALASRQRALVGDAVGGGKSGH